MNRRKFFRRFRFCGAGDLVPVSACGKKAVVELYLKFTDRTPGLP